MEDITKLPKWAQNRIMLLERKVDELVGDIAARDGSQKTGVSYTTDFSCTDEVRRFIPTDTVRFHLPKLSERHVTDCYIEVRKLDDHIEVRTQGTLVIRPRVTNVVTIRVEDL